MEIRLQYANDRSRSLCDELIDILTADWKMKLCFYRVIRNRTKQTTPRNAHTIGSKSWYLPSSDSISPHPARLSFWRQFGKRDVMTSMHFFERLDQLAFNTWRLQKPIVSIIGDFYGHSTITRVSKLHLFSVSKRKERPIWLKPEHKARFKTSKFGFFEIPLQK